ncbi:MAG: GreA/GreB family elongation factor [Brevinema sp.]
MAKSILNKDSIVEELQQKLNDEKWTNTPAESFTVRSFVELDSIIDASRNAACTDELTGLCREHLKNAPQSVIGLYVVGAVSLQQSSMDDSYLPQLIKTFFEAGKNKVVEFLCEKLLAYREHKYALRTLEHIYTASDDKDALFNIKKRLVLVDSADAANAKFLGEFYEAEDKDLAMFYYRLAIERFIYTKNIKMIEELWSRIISLYPEDVKMIVMIAKKIREASPDEYVAALLFNTVAKNMIKEEKNKLVLPILKMCVGLHPAEKQYRKAIEDCYREIYKDHHQLDHYLKASNVGQTWKPYREAIRFFESHIAFDAGSHVFHKTWGIGIVSSIEKDIVKVSFTNKKDHQMSLAIALRSLSVLDEDHIYIWKLNKPEELKTMLEEEPLRILELIMRSNDTDSLSSKELKEILVPDFLSDKEWTRWWTRTRKSMEFSNTVVASLAKRNVIELRDTERSVVEELISRFKKTTSFENKLSVALNFVIRGGDINSVPATALREYFLEILNIHSESAERKALAYAVLRYAKCNEVPDLDTNVLASVKHFSEFYSNMDFELQKITLIQLQKREDWGDLYRTLILGTPLTKNHSTMLQELVTHGKWEEILRIISEALAHFQEKPELFVWVARHALDELKDDLATSVSPHELVLRMVSLIDIINSDIGAKSAVGRNKKVLTQLEDLLFKKKMLSKVIESADESTAQSLFALVLATQSFEKEQKEDILVALTQRYPHLKTVKPAVTRLESRYPFLVTKTSLDGKRRDFERLVNTEIPENSQAIGEAMEKGDLRENAEYKAALEKQDQLKALVVKLEKEIAQARIIDKEKININYVDVGTKVKLEEKTDGVVEYQILDPWSANSDKGIISYHSPLGHALLDKKKDQNFKFEFNGETKEYKVLEITIADFE